MKSSSDPDDTIQNNNGRKNKRSLAHEYFIYDEKNDVSNYKTCSASIKGSNLNPPSPTLTPQSRESS
jgi:hypothetical protein